MSQEVLNSSENINIPHGISLWFQEDFSGNYLELGDCLINEVTPIAEFAEFRSYRNGRNVMRKRLLTTTGGTISAVLNEPNIVNLQRVVYGGTVESAQSVTAYEGRHLTVREDTDGLYVDLSEDASESDVTSISVSGIYLTTDVLEASAITPTSATPDASGKVHFVYTDLAAGDTVYVKYSIPYTSMYSTELFGATESTIEGSCRFQARNMKGGIVQIWDLASVVLSPNGGLSYPLDAVQTVPLLLSLQERSGTYGKLYVS